MFKSLAVVSLMMVSGIASASPCAGNFELVANNYRFDMRLDQSFDGFSGYLTQTYSPTGYWSPMTSVQASCDGHRMNLKRFIDTGVQNYTLYDDGHGGWSGFFTSPNYAGTFAAYAYPK